MFCLLKLFGQAEETDGISKQLGNLREKEIERKQQIAGNRANIEKLKEATENRPANVDTTELDKEIVSRGLILFRPKFDNVVLA